MKPSELRVRKLQAEIERLKLAIKNLQDGHLDDPSESESDKQLEDYAKGLEKRLKKIDGRTNILLSFEGVYSLAARNRIKEIHKLAQGEKK